jgi:hypothetical protein
VLVGLIGGSQEVAVHAPGTPIASCVKRGCNTHTSDWRAPEGSPANTHAVSDVMRVVPLLAMLGTQYPVEAHFSSYVLYREGVVCARQPRIAKDALPWLKEQGFDVRSALFVADVDTPGHEPWTEDLRDELRELFADPPEILRTVGYYLSPRGLRVIQPLAEFLDVEDCESRQRSWLQQLSTTHRLFRSAADVHDWTRLSRVAHYHRSTKDLKTGQYVTKLVSFAAQIDTMVRIDPPEPTARMKRTTPRRPSGAMIGTWSEKVPPGWEHVADAIGAAIRDTVSARWRDCYLATAGALLERGAPPEGIPAIIRRAHCVDSQWLEYTADRVEIARTTVLRWIGGAAVSGSVALRASFPSVATAIDTATTEGAVRRVLAQLNQPKRALLSLAEAKNVLDGVLETPYGVTVVIGSTGLGKSSSTVKRVRRLPVIGDRAKPGERWAFSVPQHRLAEQLQQQAPKRVARRFGPLSHRTKGVPTCQFHEAATHLASGGQSVELEFCQGRGKSPCNLLSSCEARAGWSGPVNANLVVGPHDLLGALSGDAGPKGVLVIDEPPPPHTAIVFSEDDLATAFRFLSVFEARFADAMRPVLSAILRWFNSSTPDVRVSLPEALRLAGITEDELANALTAIPDKAKSHAPPVRWAEMAIARRIPGRAREIGIASKVLNELRLGLVAPVPPVVRAQGIDLRSLVMVGIDLRLQTALRRVGPVLVLDASADVHLQAIERVLGYAPTVVRCQVGDGAPIARAVLPDAQATRNGWIPCGVPDWAPIASAVRVAAQWLTQRGVKSLGVIAAKPIAAKITDPSVPTAGLLAPFAVTVAHYGALEGLDLMSDCDAILTLGDPRPNLGLVRDQLALCGRPERELSARLQELAAAELEQAHGRLRTVHRTRPGCQLHVGTVLPAGWEGLDVELLARPSGRPKIESAMTAAEFVALKGQRSARSLARELNVSSSAVSRYLAGERPIPSDVARAVLALSVQNSVQSVPETPPILFINIDRGGFGDSGIIPQPTGTTGEGSQ